MTVATLPRVVPSSAVVLSSIPVRVRVRVEQDYGLRAWARTNPGPVSVLGVVAVEGVVAAAGMWFGFFVAPWWAPAVMLGGAWLDWRQRWDERRYMTRWARAQDW